MKNHLSIAMASVLTLSAPVGANAQLYFTTSLGGGVPAGSGATVETFDEPSPSILTLSGNAYLVTGADYGVPYIAPCMVPTTAAFFGEPVYSGLNGNPWDASQYVAVWDGGSATLKFPTSESYLGLLWGSVDQGNTLTFYDSSQNVIGTITGSQIPVVTFGGWDPSATAYVNVTSTTAFSSVVATYAGGGTSFEFDDVAYAMSVPEPAINVLVGGGLFILLFASRPKRLHSVSGN